MHFTYIDPNLTDISLIESYPHVNHIQLCIISGKISLCLTVLTKLTVRLNSNSELRFGHQNIPIGCSVWFQYCTTRLLVSFKFYMRLVAYDSSRFPILETLKFCRFLPSCTSCSKEAIMKTVAHFEIYYWKVSYAKPNLTFGKKYKF